MAPPQSRSANWRYDKQQVPEPLPSGAVGGAMMALGIGLALTFLLLKSANHFLASFDGPAHLTVKTGAASTLSPPAWRRVTLSQSAMTRTRTRWICTCRRTQATRR